MARPIFPPPVLVEFVVPIFSLHLTDIARCFVLLFTCRRKRLAPLRRQELELERGRPLGGARGGARASGGRGRRRPCVRAAVNGGKQQGNIDT